MLYWQTIGYGTTAWPACGEIDIMEHWGSNQNYVSAALHTPSSFGATVNTSGLYATDVSNTFHIYEMEWDQNQIVLLQETHGSLEILLFCFRLYIPHFYIHTSFIHNMNIFI